MPKAKAKKQQLLWETKHVEVYLSFITAFFKASKRRLEGTQDLMDISYTITTSLRFNQMPTNLFDLMQIP